MKPRDNNTAAVMHSTATRKSEIAKHVDLVVVFSSNIESKKRECE